MKIVNRINWTQIIKILLIFFGFYITLSILSNTFDGDLGWHLRFGQDAWNNNFQYTDSYTWGYLNNKWFNHEWGGDLVFWLLYNKLGYFSLNIFVGLSLWLGFLLIPKAFKQPITVSSILISLLALISVNFITVTRLAMLGPLFLVWLLWTLETLPNKKTYYYWPLILWLWSFFHGSWILGFIVINIYLFGNILGRLVEILQNHFQHSPAPLKIKLWKSSIIKNVFIWQIISVIAIIANPYGWKMWQEVITYFGSSYFKLHITEWLSSYTYPVFWWPLAIASFSAVIIYIGFKNKKISYSQVLLFIAFFISGWMYKRNNLFMVLICIPIIIYAWKYFISQINLKNNYKRYLQYTIAITIILSIVISLKPTIYYTNNVWQDNKLMSMFGMPKNAVEFLNKEITTKNTMVFNSYSWGGYLIWALPNALYFADGRSAATWKTNNEYILKQHLDFLTQPNKLQELEKNGIKYIVLQQNYVVYRAPTWYDKLIFNEDKITEAMNLEPAQIYLDLEKSNNWAKIYNDRISVVWKNL